MTPPLFDSRRVRSTLSCALALGAVCVVCLGVGGCYKRVVAARGLGAGAYDISEPYQENSKVDDWVFGPKPSHNKVVRPSPQPE